MEATIARLDAGKKKAKSDADVEARLAGRGLNDRKFADDELDSVVSPETLNIIIDGVPKPDRLDKFQTVINALFRLGFTIGDAYALLSRYPDGIAEKFNDRLEGEIERSFKSAARYELDFADWMDNIGEDNADGGADNGTKFPFTPFEKIQFSTAPAYLVKGILPREGVGVVWGKPKCGKSFWAYDLVMHVALGWRYRKRRVKQCAVAYLALEGAHGFKNRIAAWRKKHLEGYTNPVPFYLCDRPMPAGLAVSVRWLIESVNKTIGVSAPGLIVLDTLNRSLAGSESSDKDMGAYIKAADTLRETFHCFVLIIHHCGLAEERPRGHTSLTGAVDVQISIKRNEDDIIFTTVEFLKDGEEGATITSKLETVPLGADDDGEHVNSCVIVANDGAGGAANKPYAILIALELSPTISQRELAQKCRVSRGSVEWTLKRLTTEKLIKKKPLSDGYTITKAGKDALKERANRNDMLKWFDS